MMQFEVPLKISPVVYSAEQMAEITPQIDKLLESCDNMISKAKEVVETAEACVKQAEVAAVQISEPLRIENRVSEAQYAFRQLKKKLGLAPKRTYYELRAGHCTIQGKRPSNEDAHVIETVTHDGRTFTLAAVFDGHAGSRAAGFCADNFRDFLTQQDCFPCNVEKALRQAFIQLDAEFCKLQVQSGCTATAMVFEHNDDNIIYTANAGDARIIFNNDGVQQATIDHKPSSATEKQRIEAAGSFVTTIFGVARVAGQLAVSRAIGDYDYKQFGVTAEPETMQYEDLDDLKYTLLACDGLYDVLSNEEIDFAMQTAFSTGAQSSLQRMATIGEAMDKYMHGDTQAGDELLMKMANIGFINYSACSEPKVEQPIEERAATAMTRIGYMLGSMDNITCIVLRAVRQGQQE